MSSSNFMKLLNYILIKLILTFHSLAVLNVHGNCHSHAGNSKYYLATKTPYSYVANANTEPMVFDACTAFRIWGIFRHGTRYPGKVFDKMKVDLPALKRILIENHESGKGYLCSEDVDELRIWEPSVDQFKLKFLTHEGEEEMLLLGERMQNRFPGLLPELYSNKSYKFRHTATQRARESSQYFTTGLFGRRQKAHVWYPEPLKKDPILRFYKLCKKWQKEVKQNVEALAEVEKFKAKPLVTKMLDNISQRIGLSKRIKFEDAKLVYQACAFETAWHPKKSSPWCVLLAEEDLEILEYAEDLKYYWIDGYGFPVTYQQACVAVADMFHHLLDDSYPPRTFYFTHSGTILKLLSHLRLYKDPQPLLADLLNKTRLWRTSNIDSFGSNIVFILYRCKDTYKVLTLHQERPVTLPGCPEGDLCPLELLMNLYSYSLDQCHFDRICDTGM